MVPNRTRSGLFLIVLVLGLITIMACSAATTVDSTVSQPEVDSQTYRWVAMGKAYERLGLLNVDSEAAAEVHAFRWQAMAQGYRRLGLLNVDSEAAAEAMAYRWQAMAQFYADHDSLNE